MDATNSVSIQPIDKSTVHKICSGQVVLNLATAVKELLENSIDAGANSIQIKLGEYGSEFVEVIDNGCGIEDINFQALTLKHHTSKIKEFDDVYNVETFGFRGEALSSLCSLSDVTVFTQHKDSTVGAILKFDHSGIIISKVKSLRKVGTTVRLDNLFCTLPVRRTEFLKNLKREFSKMCNVLYAYGLQSIGVRITCTNQVSKLKVLSKDSKENHLKRVPCTLIMDTKGESLEGNIISIFGFKQKQNLLKVTEVLPSYQTLSQYGLENKNLNLEKFKIDGYISSCAHGCGRANSDRQFYFINSRPVDNNKISKLVNDVYHQYNNHQDPFVVLNIKVASGQFDLNVTPDKRQILLQQEVLLLAVLKESLLKVFQNVPSILEMQNVDINKSISTKKTESSAKILNFKDHFRKLFMKKEEKLSDKIHENNDKKFQVKLTNLQFEKIALAKKKVNPDISKTDDDFSVLNQTSLESKSKVEYKVEIVKEEDSSLENMTMENLNETNKIQNVKEVEISEKVNCKRKLPIDGTEETSEQIIDEEKSENSELKRLRLDEGLKEDEKKKRKSVVHHINFSEMKKMRKLTIKKKELLVDEVKFLTEIKPQNNEKAEKELKKEITKESFKQMEIIGQFNLGFIITKLNSDIFIIDQHASDEKYNFETLQSSTTIQSQRLFNPKKLELTVDKEELMLQHRDIFIKNGFEFTFDHNAAATKRINLTAIPFSKNTLFGNEDVDELLFFLENAPESTVLRPSRVNAMFASRACRKSVMIGTALNHQEMRKIVDHMGEIEHPWNCPHGRPTMRHLVNLQMINPSS